MVRIIGKDRFSTSADRKLVVGEEVDLGKEVNKIYIDLGYAEKVVKKQTKEKKVSVKTKPNKK